MSQSLTKDETSATLALKDDGLWLVLETPRGKAAFNLKYKLNYHSTKDTVFERVASDYFRRIA